MKLTNFFSNFIINENKIIYLIFLLPISLLVGSLITNSLVVIIIFIFILEIFKKKNNILNNKEFKIFIIFYFYLILNSFFLTQTLEGVIRAIGFIRFPLLAFAIGYYFSINNGKYEKKILNFWFITFLIVTIDIIFEFIFGFNSLGFKSEYEGRIASFTGDELKIGGFYFGFIFLALIYINKNLWKYKYFFIAFFLLTSLLIGERANFLKVFFIISIFLFFIDRKFILRKISLITIFIIFIFVTIKSLPTEYLGRYKRLIDYTYIDIDKYDIKSLAQANRHIGHYVTSIEVFKENPFFGVGLKNFRNVSYNKKYNLIKNVSGGSNHPHQFHFEILSELGLFGYIFLIGMLSYFIIKGLKMYLKNKDMLYFCSSIFILATVLPLIPSGSFFTTYTATIFWINFSFVFKKNNFL